MSQVLTLVSGQVLAIDVAHGIRLSGSVEASATYYFHTDAPLTLTTWRLTAIDGATGSVQVDILYDSGSGYTSITNGNEPAISADTKASGTTSGWSTTSIPAGADLAIHIDSLSIISAICLSVTG